MLGVAADAEVGNVGSRPRVALTAAPAGCQGVSDAAASSTGAADTNRSRIIEDENNATTDLGDWLLATLGAAKVMYVDGGGAGL